MNKSNRINRTKPALNSYFAFALVLIVLLGFTIKFFVSLPPYSETYRGTLSVEAYPSVESASVAYLSNEIDSPSSKSQMVAYRATKKLNRTQIDELKLEEEFEQVEQVEITYIIGETTYKSKIYTCYLEQNGYKYFAPPLYIGENITSGYYASVISSSNFQNCTLKLQSIASIELFGIPVKTTINYTLQIADGLAYYKETGKALGYVSNREIYCFDGPDCIYGLAKESFSGKDPETGETVSESHDWMLAEIILPFGMPKSISEFSLFGIYEGMDHSFFEKTRTGFATKQERKQEFTSIVSQNLTRRALTIADSSLKPYLEKIYKNANWDYDCNYVVSDGHLRQVYLKQYFDFKNVDWEKIVGETPPDFFIQFMKGYSVTTSLKCDIVDIGSTSFTVDPQVQNLILQYQ